MRLVDGVMKMQPLKFLELPAGSPVILAPGGLHLMLLGLRSPLVAGGEIALDLEFEAKGKRWKQHLRVPIREKADPGG